SGKEGVAITCADRLGADRLRHPRYVGGGLRPDLVLGAAADGEKLPGNLADLAIGVDNMGRAAGDAFQKRAVEVATRVGEVQAEDHAFCVGVVDGRTLAREVW